MHNGLTMVQDKIQMLVDTLIDSGVVCKTSVHGELLLELYSLLECLEPAADDLPERLSQVRFIPTRTEAWDSIWYISLCQMSSPTWCQPAPCLRRTRCASDWPGASCRI